MSNWYKKSKRILVGEAFGTDPFGGSHLSDKARSSPWGHAGGDEKTGVFEPSSGKHHANDYMSEEGQQSLTEKELEELKKKKKKKRKKKIILKRKKKAQLEIDCDLFDTLTPSETQLLANNLAAELRLRGSGETSHHMLSLVSAMPLISMSVDDCPGSETSCDVKRNCQDVYNDRVPRIKGKLEQVLNFLGVSISEALNNDFEKSRMRKSTAPPSVPEHLREYFPLPKGLSKSWYRKMLEVQKENNLASIDDMPKKVLVEVINRFASQIEKEDKTKAYGLRGLLSFLPVMCASKNIKIASDVKRSHDEVYSLFLKNAKIEINKGLKFLQKESQWGLEGPKMPTWRDSDWLTETYHSIVGDEKPEKGQDPESQTKEKPEEPVMEFLIKATVTVSSVSEMQQEIGSAFFIGPNLLLTCSHVVMGGEEGGVNTTIRFNNQEHECIVVASDPVLDVAVISFKDNFEFTDPLKIGDSGNILPGEKIFTVGTPLGFENVVGEGIVSSSPVEYSDIGGNKKYMFISSNINPGNSGGPVIKQSDGTVIGIAAAVINTEEAGNAGLNAAIPIDDIKVFLRNNSIEFGENQNAI